LLANDLKKKIYITLLRKYEVPKISRLKHSSRSPVFSFGVILRRLENYSIHSIQCK
jgi:hypothetical protein